jgi:hypothetical protein
MLRQLVFRHLYRVGKTRADDSHGFTLKQRAALLLFFAERALAVAECQRNTLLIVVCFCC